MKVIKKINNNVAVCVDSNGRELIAFGTGIGFKPVPYMINDLNVIQRTYYGINDKYLGLLNEVPSEMFEISAKIIDYAENKIENEFDPNLIFTLADHVNFVIDRYHKNINMKYPLQYDVEGLYPSEMAVGRASVKFINKVMKIQLPSSEAAGIALHFINAEQKTSLKDGVADSDRVINEITHIIEKDLGITIDRNTINYSRYATHIQYLLKRRDTQVVISTENHKIYDSVKKDFPQIYECVLQILDYFETNLHWKMNDEELLYLMLHINRLCSREDCYR